MFHGHAAVIPMAPKPTPSYCHVYPQSTLRPAAGVDRGSRRGTCGIRPTGSSTHPHVYPCRQQCAQPSRRPSNPLTHPCIHPGQQQPGQLVQPCRHLSSNAAGYAASGAKPLKPQRKRGVPLSATKPYITIFRVWHSLPLSSLFLHGCLRTGL